MDDLVAFFREYLTLPDTTLVVMAAWVAASYIIKSFERFPHLAVTSPTPRCGKTRVLEVLAEVAKNPLATSNISPSALYRTIAKECPTLLFDEAQSLNNRSERSSELKTLLNASISREAVVIRSTGKNWEKTQRFSVCCPKVIAMVGSPDSMLADRCLPVTMKRRTKGDIASRWISREVRELASPIKENLEEWTKDYKEIIVSLHEIYCRKPFEIENDRFAELLTPLQAVLQLSGNGYDLLKDYAFDLDKRDAHKLTLSEMLLFAIRDIFYGTEAQYIPSKELLDQLIIREEEPWSTWRKGEPMNQDNLSFQLKQYGIFPQHSKDKRSRGYWRADFLESWDRYLPPRGPSSPSEASE